MLVSLLAYTSVACMALEWAGGVSQARLEDSELAPFLAAAQKSKRAALGFSPLPVQGLIRVERPRSKRHYDVMLHIDLGGVSRTVSFLLKDSRPVWSGEQEIHYSGKRFTTVDGDVAEFMVISYSTVEGDGAPLGGYVQYHGEDPELNAIRTLSVVDAQRVWARWAEH